MSRLSLAVSIKALKPILMRSVDAPRCQAPLKLGYSLKLASALLSVVLHVTVITGFSR
jgi:hypothetical protein